MERKEKQEQTSHFSPVNFVNKEFCYATKENAKKNRQKEVVCNIFSRPFFSFCFGANFFLKSQKYNKKKKKSLFFLQRLKKRWNVDVHGGGRWRAGLFKRRRGSIDGSPGCAGSTAAGAKRLPACMYTTTFFVFTSRRERRDMHHDAM